MEGTIEDYQTFITMYHKLSQPESIYQSTYDCDMLFDSLHCYVIRVGTVLQSDNNMQI